MSLKRLFPKSFVDFMKDDKAAEVLIYFPVIVLTGILVGFAWNEKWLNAQIRAESIVQPYAVTAVLSQWLVTFAGFWVALVVPLIKLWKFVFKQNRVGWSLFFGANVFWATVLFVSLISRLEFVLVCPSDKGISTQVANLMIFSLLKLYIPFAVSCICFHMLAQGDDRPSDLSSSREQD